MLEARRRAYLSAMGLVQYTPVAAIGGAKASHFLEPEQVYPELAEVDVFVDPVPAAIDVVVTRPNEAKPDLQNGRPITDVVNTVGNVGAVEKAVEGVVASTEAARTPSAALPSISDVPPETPDIKITPLDDPSVATAQPVVPVVNEQLRFALTMVEVPGKLMVLADLSSADAMGCSALEYQLLQALLKSIHIDAEPSQHLFRWPLINNRTMVQGRQEAADGLHGFLMAKLEKLQVSQLLLIGEFASGFMPENLTHSAIPFAGQTVQCFRVPSMQSMLTDWSQKPMAWKALVQLKQSLR
ncbi:hypothetical protein A9Q99_03365 [Gammaproteobacteria bacterium 45_16_T64]|nr:hypothetical protein A9Q99_03365 [Gammaproteobacteria bacterium 45_16_T64]